MSRSSRRGAAAAAALATAAELVLLRGAAAVEEVLLMNAEPIHGNWRIAEVELYSDTSCKAPLRVDLNSTYVSPLPAGKVWRHDILNPGEDCYGKCREVSSGFCDWCGLGNACCRRGDQSDPPECQYAVGFSGDRHECVAVAPHGPLMQLDTQAAFDGSLLSSFGAPCPGPGGCVRGSLMIGTVLAEKALVRCAVVSLPAADLPAVEPFHLGKRLQFWRRRSPQPAGQSCPGLCRSGRYLESASYGMCPEFISLHGWCGRGPAYASGVDCRGCHVLEHPGDAPWEALDLRIVRSEPRQGGELRALRFVQVEPLPAPGAPRAAPWEEHRDRDGATVRSSGEVTLVYPTPTVIYPGQPPKRELILLHPGQDCWGRCVRSKSGYCANFCGMGNACCRRGFDGDPSECSTAYGFTGADQHECVRTHLLHEGEDCWGACGGKSGYCDWCGRGNACCKKGFQDDPSECQAAIHTATSFHHCVRLSHHNVGFSLRGFATQAPSPRALSEAPPPQTVQNVSQAAAPGTSVSVSIQDTRPSIEEDALVVQLWISVCVLSAALGAALSAACLLFYLGRQRQPVAQREEMVALSPAGAVGGAYPYLLQQQRRLALKCGEPVHHESFDNKKTWAIEWTD